MSFGCVILLENVYLQVSSMLGVGELGWGFLGREQSGKRSLRTKSRGMPCEPQAGKEPGNSPALRPNGSPWRVICKDWQQLSWVCRLTVTAGCQAATGSCCAGEEAPALKLGRSEF